MYRTVAALSRLFLILPNNFTRILVMEVISMKTGDLVSAETFSGKRVRMRVVDLEGDTVYICKENEWLSAKKENREPCSVGFNRRYISPPVTH
jgi:hypothetical protein